MKTIKLPTLDHKLGETNHSYENNKIHDIDVQTITKQQYQETEKTEARTECSNKQSVAEKYYQLPKKEKRVTIKLPTESTEKTHESKLHLAHEAHKEFRESENRKLPGCEETIQGPPVIGPKKRLIVEQKQENLNKSAQKVVKQKVTDAHLDSQTQNSQQIQIPTSESQVEHKKLPQPYNNLQEEKCLSIKGMQQKQVFSNTKDSKQEITQNKSLFSSVKESQQDDGKCAVNILEFLRKREELQQILSRVKEFEAEPDKNGLTTFQTLLNIIPVWLLSEEKENMEFASLWRTT